MGLSEVSDPNYVPTTMIDAQNFNRKNAFMFTALLECIETSGGRSIVLKHTHNRNAQAILAELRHDNTSSVAGALRCRDMRQKLASMRLDMSWKRSQTDFLHSFERTLMSHNDNVSNPSFIVDDSNAKELLTTAVYYADNLRAVSIREMEDVIGKNGQYYTFEQYQILLRTAAALFDSTKRRGTTRANYTDINGDADSVTAPTTDSDTNAELSLALDVNAVRSNGPRLPAELFNVLNRADRTNWIGMSDTGKAAIIEAMNPTATRKVKVHNVGDACNLSPITSEELSSTVPSDDQPNEGALTVNHLYQ